MCQGSKNEEEEKKEMEMEVGGKGERSNPVRITFAKTKLAMRKSLVTPGAANAMMMNTDADERQERDDEEEKRREESTSATTTTKRVIPCAPNTLHIGGAAANATADSENGARLTEAGHTGGGRDEDGRRRRVPGFIPERQEDLPSSLNGNNFASKWDGEDAVKRRDDEPAQAPPTFGLTVMKRGPPPRTGAGGAARHPPPPSAAAPTRAAPAVSLLTFDISSLPDDQLGDARAYEDMPVEEFGAALLRGMGWEDGKETIDRSGRKVKPVMYVARPQQLGLGADIAAAPTKEKRGSASTSKRAGLASKRKDEKNDFVYVAPTAEDGKVRHVVSIDEKLVKRRRDGVTAEKGKRMYILGGPHSGLACEVIRVDRDSERRGVRCTVRLERSGECVDIDAKNLSVEKRTKTPVSRDPVPAAVGGGTDDPANAQEGNRDRGHSREAAYGTPPTLKRRRDAEDRGDGTRYATSSVPKRSASSASHHRPWLRENIRVRVVDKHVHSGKIYLKKATVIDVSAPGVCTLNVDDVGIVHGVREAFVETVVPRVEGTLLVVVRGRHRGELCRMVRRMSSEGCANVKFITDFSFHTIDLDYLAAFVGPADD